MDQYVIHLVWSVVDEKNRGVYSSQQLEIFPNPPYFQLEKLPQTEHDKSSVVEAFLPMFKEVNLSPFCFQGHQIKFYNIAKGVMGACLLKLKHLCKPIYVKRRKFVTFYIEKRVSNKDLAP